VADEDVGLPAAPGTGTAPDWYPVGGNTNDQAYWDGEKWTARRRWSGAGWTDVSVGTGQQPTSFAAPTYHSAAVMAQRFYAITTIVGAPIFMFVFAVIAVAALSSHSGRPVGIGAAVLTLLFGVVFSRMPYVAIVGADGSLTFKALLRAKVTTISRVSRIWWSQGARGGSWMFDFDGTSSQLGALGGSALARYLIAQNPGIDYPRGRLGL